MKVLPFTIPVAHDKTIIVQEENLPYFYPHLHRHDEIQLTLVLKGKGTLIVGNSMHAFGPNEVFFDRCADATRVQKRPIVLCQ